jgi:hypothetical protein
MRLLLVQEAGRSGHMTTRSGSIRLWLSSPAMTAISCSIWSSAAFLASALIPRPPHAILSEKSDYVLILPWNQRDGIVAQLAGIREWGGKSSCRFRTPLSSTEQIKVEVSCRSLLPV